MARPKKSETTAANLGFEAKLWLAADKLRNTMDAAEHKHVVLGLIFLKYISDRFDEHHAKLKAGKGEYAGANPEDADEYRAENIFWVPPAARWSHLQNSAKPPTIRKIVDDAMVAIECDKPDLKGVLPKLYDRPGLNKQRLGELIDVIANTPFINSGWFRNEVDLRWQFGMPRIGNAKFAWVQHFNHHLALDINIGGRQR